jgi:hypothetical protein
VNVSENDFHGLAIRNAFTWPMLAPRSYNLLPTIKIPWLHKSNKQLIYPSHFNLQVLAPESYRLFGCLAYQQYREG